MEKNELVKFQKRCSNFLGCVSHDEFHSDWNWIMEIVEAIEKLERTNVYFSKTHLGEYTIEITYNEGIKERLNKTKKVFVRGFSKKEAVVEAINQFLIWYENHK